jgi:Spy/CpxP family protein refolding chaperone
MKASSGNPALRIRGTISAPNVPHFRGYQLHRGEIIMNKALFVVASLALVTLSGRAAVAQKPTVAQSTKKAERREEKAEKSEFKMAREQNKRLLKGIKLTAAQKEQVKDIVKKHGEHYKSIEKQERDADKAGQPSEQFMTQLQQMREQEKTDLRAVLTPDQQARFDQNATPKPKKG